jgi:Mrp family chromosome partitioning ATPase
MNQLLMTPSRLGLLDVLSGRARMEEVLVPDRESGMVVLPLGDEARSADDILFSPAMEQMLERLRAGFKMVILDAGPVLMVAETRSLAARADAVLFITRWRRTPIAAAQDAVRLLENAGAFIAGAALTQIDPRRAGGRRYGSAADAYPFYREEAMRLFKWGGYPQRTPYPAQRSGSLSPDAAFVGGKNAQDDGSRMADS